MTILLKCLHLCNVKQDKLQFSDNNFPKFFFQNFPKFCPLLLTPYFSKNFAGKIGAAQGISPRIYKEAEFAADIQCWSL